MKAKPVATPASRRPRLTVAVLGAGVAGLTAAHELADRGFLVTVYEAKRDERRRYMPEPAADLPHVKLGGLAASQYALWNHPDRQGAQLRPFPGRRGIPAAPSGPVAAEHGFRFFPSYYLHIWDQLERIPVYAPVEGGGWTPTARTVMDNVERVIVQAVTTGTQVPPAIFPREQPRSIKEFTQIWEFLTRLGYSPNDVGRFIARLFRYLVTCPDRRGAELADVSAYDYFTDRRTDGTVSYVYSPQFNRLLREMPKVLAAFDSAEGDVRTNLDTFVQLQQALDRPDAKADGVLNGPTTEAWFDHWYRHLVTLGVEFAHCATRQLKLQKGPAGGPAAPQPRVEVLLEDGRRLRPDYIVVAVDAPGAEKLTQDLRDGGTGGTVAELERFTTSSMPPDNALQPRGTRPREARDVCKMSELGLHKWDRFQTMAGIQFFFDTEFQLVRGHVYYSGSEWCLSSINQHGLWERRPSLERDGYVSVLSVDVCDFNTPCPDVPGGSKAARDCTPDELAVGVWRQIARALSADLSLDPDRTLPTPAWYVLDRNLVIAKLPDGCDGPPEHNYAPYLIPIKGDWENRPGADPWDPYGSDPVPAVPARNRNDAGAGVWQAGHGGYEVIHDTLVFAGTWTKTFTRMTSMEAACESARHAVNAILDHYIWCESGGTDRRDHGVIPWGVPSDFLDQGDSDPVRLPTPAGDYCFVYDMERREPSDLRALRDLDAINFDLCRPHILDDLMGPYSNLMPRHPPPPDNTGAPTMTPFSPSDYANQLFQALQQWRTCLEQLVPQTSWPTATGAPSSWPLPFTPPLVPPQPPPPPSGGASGTTDMSPSSSPPAADSTDGRAPATLFSHTLVEKAAAIPPPPPLGSAFSQVEAPATDGNATPPAEPRSLYDQSRWNRQVRPAVADDAPRPDTYF